MGGTINFIKKRKRDEKFVDKNIKNLPYYFKFKSVLSFHSTKAHLNKKLKFKKVISSMLS